jgi:hypothetical protein
MKRQRDHHGTPRLPSGSVPTTGVPFRAYFFWFGSVAWFDQDVDSSRVWGSGGLEQVWPDVASMMVADHAEQAPIERAYPVSPTVLRISRASNHIGGDIAVYVDVLRGVEVPSPIDEFMIVTGNRQVISWDPGPVVMTLDPPGLSLQLVDLRTGLRSPAAPFDWGNPQFPILAIPGEPVRRFWTTVPPQVESRAADGSQVMQNLSDVFPQLPLSGVDAATVMYGDFRRPTVSDLTADLDDGELNALANAARVVQDEGPRLLAVLALLTRASPAAYHPDGHFGIAHLTAEQLVGGGWLDPPDAIIRAGAVAQLETLGRYLATLDPAAVDTPGKVLAVLATGQPVTNGDDTVVVPAPVPARLQNLVPRDADGTPADLITLADLQGLVDDLINGPRGAEIFGRMRTQAFA